MTVGLLALLLLHSSAGARLWRPRSLTQSRTGAAGWRLEFSCGGFETLRGASMNVQSQVAGVPCWPACRLLVSLGLRLETYLS